MGTRRTTRASSRTRARGWNTHLLITSVSRFFQNQPKSVKLAIQQGRFSLLLLFFSFSFSLFFFFFPEGGGGGVGGDEKNTKSILRNKSNRMEHSLTDHLGEQVPSKPARTGKTANLHSDSLLLLLFGEGGRGNEKNTKSILRNKNNRMEHSLTDHLGEQVPSKPARTGKTANLHSDSLLLLLLLFGEGGGGQEEQQEHPQEQEQQDEALTY